MPPVLALLCGIILVAVLLFTERKRNPSASIALWLPTCWMLICASRPLGTWFGVSLTEGGFEEGSPLDRWVLILMIVLSLLVIRARKINWVQILKQIPWLLVLYLFLGLSILWSDYPFVSFKRWFRLLGAIPVAMVVLTEQSPLEAFQSIFRRCAYVLIPFSLILIKYYPRLGVGYSRWSGVLMWTGVTLTKNALGQLCLLSTLIIIWSFYVEKRSRFHLDNSLAFYADGFVLSVAIFLLLGAPSGAYSATSSATLALTSGVIFLLFKMENHARVLAKCIVALAVSMWILMIFFDSFVADVTALLGRDETFTGRTELWDMCLASAAQHPILGVGFGGYFGTDNEFTKLFGVTGHNGMLDVLVEVGVVGVLLLLGFLLSFYNKSINILNHSIDWGVFATFLLVVSLTTNFTESLFLKSSSFIWNSMIFAYLCAFNSISLDTN